MKLLLKDGDPLDVSQETAAAVLRVYKTPNDAVNYERLSIGWSASNGTFDLSFETGGTGQRRDVALRTNNNILLLTGPGKSVYAAPTLALGTSGDVGLSRTSAGVGEVNSCVLGDLRDLRLRNLVGQSGYHEIKQSAPPAGVAGAVRIYADDDGSGRTRLMAVFGTGTPQVIAQEV